MEKRTLQNGATLLLYGKGSNGEFAREFTIQEQLGCGGSAISYIASHSQSDRGVLKEFCPRRTDGCAWKKRNGNVSRKRRRNTLNPMNGC